MYLLNENKHDIEIKAEDEAKNTTNSETERASFKSALELMDRIINGSLTNGIALVTNQPKTNENCLEISLTKQALEQYNLKRILLINFDLSHNSLVQKEFYNNSKFVYFELKFV